MGTTTGYRSRDRLQMTVNPIKATGYELHGVKLAGGIVASVRRPARGTARWVRHVSLRKVKDAGDLGISRISSTPSSRSRIERSIAVAAEINGVNTTSPGAHRLGR